uniref:RING-type domain-containing protein n=1 Tax=Amazona collaria TaxID=241587 RepID=A0A8B9G9X2_9PSIT
MADGERSDRRSSSPANSRRGSQAAPMDASEEPSGQEAPNIEVCMSFCRHCFCFPCIQEWARRKSVCPRCQGKKNRHHHLQMMKSPCWGTQEFSAEHQRLYSKVDDDPV